MNMDDLKYNTQERPLLLPEYGRSVQNMVDYAVSIPDRAERQRCANTIVDIMGNMFPHLRDIPDFNHKLWDHLAIMADFKLDIDYPCDIVRKDTLCTRPDNISYPKGAIRYRHYGREVQELVAKAVDYPEGEERQRLVLLIANHMKKCFLAWNKDVVDDQKIFDDLREYSNGAIDLDAEEVHLWDQKMFGQQRKGKQGKRRQKNG